MQTSFFLQMLYCRVCCEPFHQFCLEPEERPSEDNKENWCCRRCKFCHVCGRKTKHSKVEAAHLTCCVIFYLARFMGSVSKCCIFHVCLSLCWSVNDARTVIMPPVWDPTIQNKTRRGKLGYVDISLK